METAVRELDTGFPIHLGVLFGPRRVGPADPALRLAGDELWWAQRGAGGPVLVRIRQLSSSRVRGQAWGDGAAAALDHLSFWVGCADTPESFRPEHPVLSDWHRRHPQLRMTSHPAVFDTVAAIVLRQRVTWVEAARSWAGLARRFGSRAPQPAGAPALFAPPAPESWRRVSDWEWHRAGVEARRARAVVTAAEAADGLDRLAVRSSAEADRALRSLPGIGVWTSAEVRQRTHGDPDAVSVGDYDVPKLVGVAFTGRRTDDAGMLRLLAPYQGQRQRVVRLISLAGVRAPRYGPRQRLRAIR